jgi:hypothetical protein
MPQAYPATVGHEHLRHKPRYCKKCVHSFGKKIARLGRACQNETGQPIETWVSRIDQDGPPMRVSRPTTDGAGLTVIKSHSSAALAQCESSVRGVGFIELIKRRHHKYLNRKVGRLVRLKTLLRQCRQRLESIKSKTSPIQLPSLRTCSMGSLVIDQGALLDRVDYNVEQLNCHVEGAGTELRFAAGHQHSSRKRLCIWLLVFLILGTGLGLFLKQ